MSKKIIYCVYDDDTLLMISVLTYFKSTNRLEGITYVLFWQYLFISANFFCEDLLDCLLFLPSVLLTFILKSFADYDLFSLYKITNLKHVLFIS